MSDGVSPGRVRRFFRRPLVWGGLALLVLVAVVLALRARGPRVPTVAVTRGDLEQHLVATGRVLAPARVEVAAQVMGLVRSVAVNEGDRVKLGDLLVQLDDDEARAGVAQADAAVARAAAHAERITRVSAAVLTQTLAQADANLESVQQRFDRGKTLFDAGAMTTQELEELKRARDVGQAQHDAAAAQLRGSGVDAREAFAGLREAQAQLTSAQVRLAQRHISAPVDAIVLSRDVEPGSTVQPGRTLLSLSVLGDARLALQPDERDLSLIELGQKARASADAFPKESFDAEVSYVAPAVEAARGTIEVRLRVPTPPAYLRPDMTVSVDLLVARRSQTLVVSSDAIRAFATPTPWALLVVGTRVERRDIGLGIRGDGSSEVLSGLAEGDQIVLPDGQILAAGQRVRPILKSP